MNCFIVIFSFSEPSWSRCPRRNVSSTRRAPLTWRPRIHGANTTPSKLRRKGGDQHRYCEVSFSVAPLQLGVRLQDSACRRPQQSVVSTRASINPVARAAPGGASWANPGDLLTHAQTQRGPSDQPAPARVDAAGPIVVLGGASHPRGSLWIVGGGSPWEVLGCLIVAPTLLALSSRATRAP